MIDLLQIRINKKHRPFGATREISRENASGNTKRLSIAIKINHVPVHVISLKNGSQIMIRCCPIKVLQGHNVFGSNNVRNLGYQIITAVLDGLGIAASAQQLHAWRLGEFAIDEIHLTHRFPIKRYSLIKQVVSHIHRYTSIALRPACIDKGTGVTLTAPNLEWMFYDKYLEFEDKRHKEHQYLEAHAPSGANNISYLISRTASRSIRAELKLKKGYLNATENKLNTGRAWTTAKVKEIFLSELAALHIGELPAVSQLSHVYKRVNDVKQRMALIMWATGQDLSEYYGKTTLEKHRRAIKKELGIDVMKDTSVLKRTRVHLADVFAPENLLAGFPSWVKKYPQVAFR